MTSISYLGIDQTEDEQEQRNIQNFIESPQRTLD